MDGRRGEKYAFFLTIPLAFSPPLLYDIIQKLKELIAGEKLEDKVNLNASFCLGQCTHGCTIRIDEDIVTGVTKDNIEDIFHKALAERG